MATYRIARRLSASAGVVEAYIGVEVSTERPVVVKRLVSPWLREAPTFAHRFLAHPAFERGLVGVPEWLEVGHARNSVWLVQALHEGESLRHVMNALTQSRSFIAPNEGLSVVAAVASILAGLHGRSRPVVHGDVSASTVLLKPDGQLLLLDAGIAGSLSPSTTNGPPRGEPFTIAPEQFTEPPTCATDVFRLGLMLYELSVGYPLFAAADAVQAMVQCQRFSGLERERIKQVPEPWHSLLLEMLTIAPRERPPAARVDAVLQQAAAKAGWKSGRDDVARLFARACGARQSLGEMARTGTQELVLGPLPPAPPAPRVAAPTPPEEENPTATTGAFSKLPVVQPQPPPTPARAPLSAGEAVPSGSAAPNAIVGRITTRKITRSELEAEKTLENPMPPMMAAAPEDLSAPKDARVGELLVERGVITRAQCNEAREQVATYGGSLADALSAIGAADEDSIVMTVADVTHTPHTTSKKLKELSPPADALALVPLDLARALELVPLGLKGGTQLMVAMKDPMDAAALEKLKSVTGLRNIVAVRGGENAIRRTRNRFYLGETDDRPDWLEQSSRAVAVPAPRPTVKTSNSGVLTVTGSLEFEPPPGAGSSDATLDSPAGRLVTALLSVCGDRGQHAGALADLCAAIAAKLGLGPADVERVRFAATAVCIANLVEGRPVFDVPSIGSLSAVLGEQNWNSLEPLLSAWLDWPAEMPDDAGPRAVCVSFAFALHAGVPLPRGSALGAALVSFKTRFKVEQSVLDLLVVGLSTS